MKEKIRGFEHVSKENREYGKKGKLPTRSTSASAGYDFYSPIQFKIHRGETKLVFTNVKAFMREKEYLQLSIRSSLALERNLILVNSPGIVDADYYNNPDNEGNIGIMLRNIGQRPVEIKEGERIAQGIFQTYFIADEDYNDEEREGGFGSTGNK